MCRGCLDLDPFDEVEIEVEPEHTAAAARLGLGTSEVSTYVDAGQLVCRACRVRFPIERGLPVMLPYATPLHEVFSQRWADRLCGDLRFASGSPVSGEDFVRASFSTEWLEYDYDGVIWELSYRDHEIRFRKEVGTAIEHARWFLEVGCGLGLATSVAHTCTGGECVGLDLSLAVTKAVREFRRNPFLHFVQASAFAPPFAPQQFDIVYSRGVLHHTYSTRKAFESVASLCRQRGVFFLWLYGPGSIISTPLRLALFALAAPSTPPATASLPGLRTDTRRPRSVRGSGAAASIRSRYSTGARCRPRIGTISVAMSACALSASHNLREHGATLASAPLRRLRLSNARTAFV
jgi:SAM-dependent methyltransferase